MSRILAPLVIVLVIMVAALAAGPPVRAASSDGEVLFNTHCRNCHSMKTSDHRLGPSLAGIVGKPAGAAQGFGAYSGSLKGFHWDEATLDKFIANPTSVAPNTSMIYPPVADQAQRQAIIEFMKTRSAQSPS